MNGQKFHVLLGGKYLTPLMVTPHWTDDKAEADSMSEAHADYIVANLQRAGKDARKVPADGEQLSLLEPDAAPLPVFCPLKRCDCAIHARRRDGIDPVCKAMIVPPGGDPLPPREPTGAELRDDGMRRAEAHANAVVHEWTEGALGYFREFAAIIGADVEFMTEDVRQFAVDKGFVDAPDARTWGVTATKAQKLGIVRKVRYGTANRPSSHRAPRNVYVRA